MIRVAVSLGPVESLICRLTCHACVLKRRLDERLNSTWRAGTLFAKADEEILDLFVSAIFRLVVSVHGGPSRPFSDETRLWLLGRIAEGHHVIDDQLVRDPEKISQEAHHEGMSRGAHPL